MTVRNRLGAASSALLAALLSALLWFLIVGIAGISLVIVGVYALAGPGWAMVVSGAFLILLSAFIGKGMANG